MVWRGSGALARQGCLSRCVWRGMINGEYGGDPSATEPEDRFLGEHPMLYSADMTIQRMDNVLIVVDDLEAAKAFFAELGMELEGETTVEGRWVDRVLGLDGVRADITMMRTPDGHGRVELTKFRTPPAVRAEPESASANTLGIRRIMFAVDDIDGVVARLRSRGAELVGEIAQYEDIYRLCFLRGPESIIIGLAEQLR